MPRKGKLQKKGTGAREGKKQIGVGKLLKVRTERKLRKSNTRRKHFA